MMNAPLPTRRLVRGLVLALGAGTVLAACDSPRHLSPDFGNSVRHNMAVHIITPAPSYAEPLAATDGNRMANAVDTYHTKNAIEAPTTSLLEKGN